MRKLEDMPRAIAPRMASNVLLIGIVAFVTIFFIWAYFAQIERTVRGEGRVIASSQLQVVSNGEGGVVEAILVRPGDRVAAGAPLVRLDPTSTAAELGSGRASYTALQVKIARLQAEIDGREPSYPPATDAATTEQILTERALHESRLADLASLTEAARARVVGARGLVAEGRATYRSRIVAAAARDREASVLRSLVERGIEPRLALLQAESAAAVARSDAAAAAAGIDRSQAAVGEGQAALDQVRPNWRAAAATELAAARAESSARRATLPALSTRVDRTVLRAPLAGLINRVLVTTRGAAVQPAQPLVEIVPSGESLLIEARVRPEDISFVRMDQPAKVALTAYDRSVYGTVDGRVVAISPDAVTEERSERTFYLVRVRTSASSLLARTGERMPIGPGMVAEVDLLGDPRTVLEYLLTPITRLSERAFRER